MPQASGLRAHSSWRFRCRLRADRPVIVVEQGNAVIQQYLVDGRLVLLDQTVEQPLPVLVGPAHPHADAKRQSWAYLFLHERGDMERRVRVLRMEARHRSPQNAGVDL